ncbi:MAG: hypothetical protein R6V10_13075 [bacterium]
MLSSQDKPGKDTAGDNLNVDANLLGRLQTPFPKTWWIKQDLFLAGCYPGDRDPEKARQKLSGLLALGVRAVVCPRCRAAGGENEAVAIPRARELTAQIHSIKKTATEAGYARFDTEKNERHHADKFWTLALAVHAAGLGKDKRRKRQKVSASVV